MTRISPVSSISSIAVQSLEESWKRGWRKDQQGNYIILMTPSRDIILAWIKSQNPNDWQQSNNIGFKYKFSPQLETAFLLRWS